MKKNLNKTMVFCLFAATAATMGCSSGAYRDRESVYSPPPMNSSNYRGANSERKHLISPPPELVANGTVDASGLSSISSADSRRADVDRGNRDVTNYNDSSVVNNDLERDFNSKPVDNSNMNTGMGSGFNTGAAAGNYGSSASHDSAYGDSNSKSAIITFSPGSADLSEADKTKLREIVSGIGASNVKRAEVATWSDLDFPRTGSDLAKEHRKLADKRADNIKDFLKSGDLDLSSLRIKTYSMAETSNWLARMFRTDEAELKSVFSKQNEAPMAREDFNIIMNEGGASKAVVVILRK